MMNTIKLQAAFARRREADQLKFEISNANNKYFDKCSQITSRHEKWTAPTYYELIDENIKKEKMLKFLKSNVNERRKRLTELIEAENLEYEKELADLKSRLKIKNVSTEVLTGVHDTIKRTEKEQRRLDIESLLYRKWRNNNGEESILLDSKSDHEALAKMNWLDKKVAAELEREKEQKENEERHLRLQQESQKHIELLNERTMLREHEVKQFQLFQENHLSKFKECECESKELHLIELQLKCFKDEMKAEFSKFEELQRERKRESHVFDRPINNNNVPFMKTLYREYSKIICAYIQGDVELLNRLRRFIGLCNINNDHSNTMTAINDSIQKECLDNKIKSINERFQKQYQLEIDCIQKIGSYYECEAKYILMQQIELWSEDRLARALLLKNLFIEYLRNIESKIKMNIEKQSRTFERKTFHLEKIEVSIEAIKRLLNEQKKDDNNAAGGDVGDGGDGFSGLNKSIEINRNDKIQNNTKIEINNKQKQQEPKQDNIRTIPKFGRKKIAWT